MLRRYITPLFLFYLCSALYNQSYAKEIYTCPRIISQSPYITEMLTYLEMDQCIVGVSRYSKRDLPHTGGILDPDAEAITLLSPDLLITSDWINPETLKAITPAGVKVLQLKSFNKMGQLENNMMAVIKATHWKKSIPKVIAFKKAWREKIKKVRGNNKKVLLLSSCSGMSYSFGSSTRLYDLFSQAGFKVVESKKKIRHIRPGNEIEDITALLDHYQPDLLFIFEQRQHKQCQMITPNVPVKILNFDGSLFLNPETKILKGLDMLISKKHHWIKESSYE